MKWAGEKPLGAEPRGKVPPRAQQNGRASRLEEDSLPFLLSLVPQLENDVTLFSTPTQMWPFLVSTLRAGAKKPSVKVPSTHFWGVVKLQATCAPLGRLRVVRFSDPCGSCG